MTACQTWNFCQKLQQREDTSHWALTHLRWQIDIWLLIPSHDSPWDLTAVDSSRLWCFCSSWSSNSGHTIMAFETNPCHVLGCLNDLKSDTSVPFITKVIQQCADVEVIWWTFHARQLSHLWASGIVEHWNGLLINISYSSSLTFSWSTHLSKTIDHSMPLLLGRDHLLSVASWVMIRSKEVRVI